VGTTKRARSPAVARPPGWICTTCGREFARIKQWHSCKPQSVDSHFAGKDPRLRRLFDLLIRKLERPGPLRIDAVKTSINLISRHHFGGVMVRREHLRVGFLARTPIKSARIVRRQALGPGRVGHSVLIRSKEEIDVELLGWLADAQRLQS
jgi:uncharacterized protein DUF5655